MATKSANKAVVGSKVYSNPRKEVSGNETRDSINLAIDESVNQDEYNANEAARDAEISALSSSLGDYIPLVQKGVANGVVPTNENNEIPISYFPSTLSDHDSLDGIKGNGTYHTSQSVAAKLTTVNPYSFLANNTNVGAEADLVQSYAWFFALLAKTSLSEGKTYLGIESTNFDQQNFSVTTSGTTNISLASKYNTIRIASSNPSAGIRRVNLETASTPAYMVYLEVSMFEVSLSDFQIHIYAKNTDTDPLVILRANTLGYVTEYYAVLHKGINNKWAIYGENALMLRGDTTLKQIESKNVFARYETPQGTLKQQIPIPYGAKLKSITVYPTGANIFIDTISVGYTDGGADIVEEISNDDAPYFDFTVPMLWGGGSIWVNYGLTYIDQPTSADKMNIIIEYVENFKL